MKLYNENRFYINLEDGPMHFKGDSESLWRDDGSVAQTYDEMKEERAPKKKVHSRDDYIASISEPSLF